MLKRRKRDVERRKTIGRTPQNSETLETRALEMVDVDHIEPQEFWDRFVSQRKPVRRRKGICIACMPMYKHGFTVNFTYLLSLQVVLTGHPRDAEWKVHQRWSDEYLERKAVSYSCPLLSETRLEHTHAFLPTLPPPPHPLTAIPAGESFGSSRV